MRVTIVGSGTLLPDDDHRSPGHLIEHRGGSLLLDCGSGVLHGLARDGLDWAAISHVAITHFHTDHFGDLPALLWAWKHGVPEEAQRSRVVIGPAGMRRVMTALAEAYGDYVLQPGADLEIVELAPGELWKDPRGELVIRTHDARHRPESLAYRVESAEGAVGYTGDTGPHPSLGPFFRGVGLLISECSTSDRATVDLHLSPRRVAEMAVDAEPAMLALTHLYPRVDRDRLAAEITSLGYGGRVFVAWDGLRIDVI
jgi:ribonuclease BN (tRNA processing enzyme)